MCPDFFARKASRRERSSRRRRGDNPSGMGQSGREYSPAEFSERVDGLAHDVGIGIVAERPDLVDGRRISDVADDPCDPGAHFGIGAAQVPVKLVQFAVVLPEFVQVDLDLKRLPRAQSICQVVDVIGVPGLGKTEGQRVPDVWFFLLLVNLLPATGFVVLQTRSEERRVGKECRSGWSPYH